MHHSCHGDAYTNEIKNLKTLNDNEVTYLSTKKKINIITIMHHSCHGDFYINENRNIKTMTIKLTILVQKKLPSSR